MHLAYLSLRDNKVLALGTPVSQSLVSSDKVGELRPDCPLSNEEQLVSAVFPDMKPADSNSSSGHPTLFQ
jgi:hypothetical protein